MVRSARPLIHNASYHIITRGIRKENVFLCDEDFEKYLGHLWKYKNKYGAAIYAYCLMPNHVHMLIDPEDPRDLRKIMHGLNLSYASFFNRKYSTCGHLWQNRYKSFIAQNDEYLLNAVSYIEYNPVRANICRRPETYAWSSYRSRVLGTNDRILSDLKHLV
jgi:putative transposase